MQRTGHQLRDLRLAQRRLRDPVDPGARRVLGVDDWAKRKGINYGTILVNAQTGHPVDLINSRGNKDVIKWLSGHPHIRYVTRDRSSSYAKAITKALPKSIQIADKFHLVKNLSDYIYKEIQRQYREIKKSS